MIRVAPSFSLPEIRNHWKYADGRNKATQVVPECITGHHADIDDDKHADVVQRKVAVVSRREER